MNLFDSRTVKHSNLFEALAFQLGLCPTPELSNVVLSKPAFYYTVSKSDNFLLSTVDWLVPVSSDEKCKEWLTHPSSPNDRQLSRISRLFRAFLKNANVLVSRYVNNFILQVFLLIIFRDFGEFKVKFFELGMITDILTVSV